MADLSSGSSSSSNKASSTSNSTKNPSNVTSNYSSSSEGLHNYGIVFSPLRESTVLSLPEAESTEIQYPETGDLYPPTQRLPNLDFIPTNEGSLLGSIHNRIAALRSSTADAQARYSQAINSSISTEPAENPNVRMTIANALWNSTAFFTEGESAAQLLRYREMFAFLSQRYAEALASSSFDEAQNLVYRGQVAIAAIRIAGNRNQSVYSRSVAQGHYAPHSSEVTIWGWKPWREMALAEKISERRRKRVSQERKRVRERSVRKSRFLVGFKDEINQRDQVKPENGVSSGNRSIESQSGKSGRSFLTLTRTKPKGAEKKMHYFDDRGLDTEYSNTRQDDSTDTPSPGSSKFSSGNRSSTDISSPGPSKYHLGSRGPLTDGTRELEIGLAVTDDSSDLEGWNSRSKSEVQWHHPVYHEVKQSTLAFPQVGGRTGSMMPTTATVTQASDQFLRIHTINEPSGMGYVSVSPPGLRASPQVSPKSTSLNLLYGNDIYESSVPATSDIENTLFRQFPIETPSTPISPESSFSFNRVLLDHRRKQPGGSDSNSDSTVGASRVKNQLRKVKTVFKSLPLTRIHFPWSSSSEEEGGVGREGQASASTDSSFADNSSSEKSWPFPSSIPPEYGLIPPPPPPKEYYSYINVPKLETRIHSPNPKTINSPPHPGTKLHPTGITIKSGQPLLLGHRESDPLTRTEKEYQEILATLTELKRELRVRKNIQRSRSRERREDEKRGV